MGTFTSECFRTCESGQSGPRAGTRGACLLRNSLSGRADLPCCKKAVVTGSGCCLPEQVALLLSSHLHKEQAGRTEWWVPEAPEAGRAWRKPRFSLLRDCEALQKALVPRTDRCPQSACPVLPALGSRGLHPREAWSGRGPGAGQGAREGAFPTPGELKLPLPWLRLLPV